MSLPPIIRSATWLLQALIYGRITDRLTNLAPTGIVKLRLIDTDANRDYPLKSRIFPSGDFVFYGQPEQAFPRIGIYHLKLQVSAPNYQTQEHIITIERKADQPALVTRSIPLENIPDMQVRLFTAGDLPKKM